MKYTLFNENWKFWKDSNSFALVWSVPENAKSVTIPHDAMLYEKPHKDSYNKDNTGYRDGGVYVYVKTFRPKLSDQNKVLKLKFEGVYSNVFVYVNEQLAQHSPYGYSNIYVDLNDYLTFGEDNEIRVLVKNGNQNSRWYAGSGIYRNVYLLESDLTYIDADGTAITTELVEKEYAVQKIETQLVNDSHLHKELKLVSTFYFNGEVCGSETSIFSINRHESRHVSQKIIVSNPKLWSHESPQLYTCITELYEKDNLLDKTSVICGIRDIKVDANKGLRVNGDHVKLRGACIHNDSGIIGVATYYDSDYRRVRQLKEAGFNAIRMAHHPMSETMLEACDVLGIYVMDEIFDMWTRNKSPYDYSLFFNEWWERDITSMVKKDINHPSVIMYSIGNEIPEIGTDFGSTLCQKLANKVKSLDPSRYTTVAINGVFAAGDKINTIMDDISRELIEEGATKGHVNNFLQMVDQHIDKIVVHKEITKKLNKGFVGVDIAGYNYMTARYAQDHIDYPNRIIVGSETYPFEIARNWDIMSKFNHIIGDFTWVGYDYLGEAGVGVASEDGVNGGFGSPYPFQLAYSGDINLIGVRRPASYFRETVFQLRQKPYITVQNPSIFGKKLVTTPWVFSLGVPNWTWPGSEGKKTLVEVIASGDEVELVQNGSVVDKKPSGKQVGYRTFFETTYTKGILEAIVYKNGTKVESTTLKTTKECSKIATQVEYGEREELVFIEISLTDADDNLTFLEDGLLNITVEGPSIFMGFGTGNPKPPHNFIEHKTEVYEGRALAILKLQNKGETKVIIQYNTLISTIHV